MNSFRNSTPCARAVQLALAVSVFSSGAAHAALRDHGPSDPTVVYPQWYRDYNDLALGICKYADDAGSGPLCLTSPADTDPAGYPGNLGEEAFYTTFDVTLPITGGSFHYLAHLEMAYGSATGAPPVIKDPANLTEVVFSRIRIRMDVPDGCGGHYVLRHPFGINEFDVEPGLRAINYTDDLFPINGDFGAALKGHQGPFLTWDSDLPITVQPPIGAAREYIGDPNILHTFTGSAVANTGDALVRHPEHEYQNFVELIGPPGCDLGPGADQPIFDDTASISGLKWTAAIPTATHISKASYSKSSGGKNSLDVWVDSSAGQNLVLTSSDDNSPQMPNLRLKENSTPAGSYFAHVEFDGEPPPQVTVTNLSSPAPSQDRASVVDAVDITKAVYDSDSHILCVSGHSKNTSAPTPGSLEAPPYGSFVMPTPGCPAVDSNDVVLEKDLDDFSPEQVSPPVSVFVRSVFGGSDSKSVISTAAVSDATPAHMAENDSFDLPGSGQSNFDVAANDTNLPGNFRVVVVSQPETMVDGKVVPSGMVTAADAGGMLTYTAAEGLQSHDTFFHYAIEDLASNTVSNVAKVVLHVQFTAAPPVGIADAFGILRTLVNTTTARSYTANVLANDTTGLAGIAIDPATVEIATQGDLGVATPNADGTITFRACVPTAPGSGICRSPLASPAAGTDSFTYTVANTAGARSAPITVSVKIQTSAETLSVTRARFSNPRWDIRLTTNWFGAPLTPTIGCSLIRNNGVLLAVPQLIGSAAVDAVGAVQIQATAGGSVPSASGTWQIRCTSSNGATVISTAVK